MMVGELKEKILSDGSGYTFTYNGEPCGMEPTVKDSVFTFEAWSGDKNKNYSDIDELMTDKFYSGKSITELIDKVEFDFI